MGLFADEREALRGHVRFASQALAFGAVRRLPSIRWHGFLYRLNAPCLKGILGQSVRRVTAAVALKPGR